ncbi:hypothetical protein HAX54_013242, partial [Datura stramonium]|nr:hypothetical protein [Datura stramonium]
QNHAPKGVTQRHIGTDTGEARSKYGRLEIYKCPVLVQAEEAQLVDAARRVDVAHFVAALAKRKRQNPPRHHGRNAL